MEIKSIDQCIALWPANAPMRAKTGGRELEGPCPFCPAEPDSIYITINGRPISFTGSDRFYMRPNGTFGCRFCAAAGRGQGSSVRGFYTLRGLSDRFGFTVAADFQSSFNNKPSEPIHDLWFDSQVEAAHKAVQYDFWYEKCRWQPEIVDKYKLGYGILYDWHGPAHLLPMSGVRNVKDDPVDGWYMSARNPSHSRPKVKSPGSNTGYFWYMEDDPEDDSVAVAEGEKENVTFDLLGYANRLAFFGSGLIWREVLAWLWEQGKRRLILGGDNDEAGQKFNAQLGQWASELGFEAALYPMWPSSCPKGCDVTNLYVDNNGNADATRTQFESWLVEYVHVAPPDLPLDDDDEVHRELLTREELRGGGPNSVYGRIRRFRESYDKERPYGKGLIHISAPPMGTGKTQAMIRDVEEQAREHLIQRAEERLQKVQERTTLQEELDKETDAQIREELLKKIQQVTWTLEAWSVTAIAWYAQYKSQWDDIQHFGVTNDLWFNFEARNEANCANYDIAKTLGEQNHSIGRFCETVCPMRDHCREHGYLSQEVKRREKPITMFRHNNIFMTIASDYPRGIVIDENPTRLLEAYMEIKPDQLNPFDPNKESQLEDDFNYMLLKDLMIAVRQAMSFNAGAKKDDPSHRLSGADFFRLVQTQLALQGMTLETILPEIDTVVLEEYQPNFYGKDKRHIKLRCVPDLVRVMQRELPSFTKDNHHCLPSCIHLIAGRLYVFAQECVHIPSSIPVFVLDGTPLPELYVAMFNRKADIFRPDMVNANCETIVITGSDWTKSEFNSQVGRYLQKRKQFAKKIIAKSDPSNPIDVEQLPHSAEAYQSKMLQEAIQLIVGVAEKHKSLLVVSYKDMKQILKELVQVEYPKLTSKLAWGHYGNLRGTNIYEKYEAVLLIGAYRIPYDSAYLYISMWASLLGYEEPLEETLIKRKKRYHGSEESAQYITYPSTFARKYLEMLETSEALQAATRHRPHSTDEKKWIYMAAKRPMLRHTTKVVKKIDFMKQFIMTVEKMQRQYIIAEIQKNIELFGKPKKPTFRQVIAACGGSNTYVRQIFKEIDESGMFSQPGESS